MVLQEWYENLKKNFLEWKKENPNGITRNRNRKPVVAFDTVLTEKKMKKREQGLKDKRTEYI